VKDTFLGIEIGGTKLQLVAGDASFRIRERVRYAVDRKQGAAGIRWQIEAALTQLLPEVQPKAIGVGFGGPVEWRSGRIAVSHQIAGWSDFNLARWLQGRVQVPVYVDNDANVAALGEALCGAGRGFQNVFYVTVGSGVGGGLVADGMIFHGAVPGETEVGHLRLDRHGATVEATCSGWAVDQKVKEAIRQQPQGVLGQLAEKAGAADARCLAKALEEQDPAARQILQETTRDLAFGLSHVVHLLHPEVIVLGGGLSLIGEPWRAAVEQNLPGQIMEAFQPGPRVVLARLGEDAVPVGALALACQRSKGG
jgi:glucokinase